MFNINNIFFIQFVINVGWGCRQCMCNIQQSYIRLWCCDVSNMLKQLGSNNKPDSQIVNVSFSWYKWHLKTSFNYKSIFVHIILTIVAVLLKLPSYKDQHFNKIHLLLQNHQILDKIQKKWRISCMSCVYTKNNN